VTSLDLLLEEPNRFQLGPAIRLLGMAADTADPLAGGNWDIATVRVRHRLNPTIALHEVERVKRAADGTFDLTTPVLNVVGVTGVLPADVWRTVPVEQLDEFHRLTHQLVATWYAKWIDQPRSTDRFVAAFARPRSAAGLESLLAAAFALPVQVREACGGWAQTRDEAGSWAVTFDAARWCELHFGPVNRVTFEAIMPGGALLRKVLGLARRYAGPVPRFRVLVTLRKQDVETARRGQSKYNRAAVANDPAGDVTVQLRDDELLEPENRHGSDRQCECGLARGDVAGGLSGRAAGDAIGMGSH
jgi:predicted component of type VI protein secretion system